jgi:hypothetical protein
MSDDEDTPHGRRAGLLRRQAERARLIREAQQAAQPPDYDDDEPSVVEFRGKAADRLLARLNRGQSPVPSSGPVSIRVKAGKLLEKRFGKTIAGLLMTILGLVFAAVVQALAE